MKAHRALECLIETDEMVCVSVYMLGVSCDIYGRFMRHILSMQCAVCACTLHTMYAVCTQRTRLNVSHEYQAEILMVAVCVYVWSFSIFIAS